MRTLLSVLHPHLRWAQVAPAQSKQEVWYVYTQTPLIRSLWTAIIRD